MHRLLALVLLVACGTPTDDAPVDTDTDAGGPVSERTLAQQLEAGPYGVGSVELALVDASRPTQANGDYAGADDRSLPTRIWYPTAPADGANPVPGAAIAPGGPWPLIVHSHGFLSDYSHHAALAAFLASHGYIFAAVKFPLSNLNAPGGATVLDVVNQPGDVSFVIDSVLALADGPLAGAVDTDRIGLSGLSLGGFTTVLTGLVPEYRDTRASLLVTMAPSACFTPVSAFAEPGPPMLVLHGTADAIVPYDENGLALFDAANSPDKHLVTLTDGTHTGFPDITAALFDNLGNADTVGCTSVGDALPSDDDPDVADVIDAAGPLLGESCSLPCQGTVPEVAMKPLRQVDLTKAAMLAFLQAVWSDDADSRLYLERGIGVTETDVTVTNGE